MRSLYDTIAKVGEVLAVRALHDPLKITTEQVEVAALAIAMAFGYEPQDQLWLRDELRRAIGRKL